MTRSSGTRRRLLTRVAPVALTAVVAAGLTATLWREPAVEAEAASAVLGLVQPADPPVGPVEITGVDGRTTWSDEGSVVTALLRNRTPQDVTAEVWWLLASPDEDQPWTDSVARGAPQRVLLAAGQTTEVDVPVEAAPTPGRWTLSLWAHAVNGTSTQPSHGVAVTPLVTVLPTAPEVERLGQPGTRAVLSVVEPVGRLATADNSGTQIGGPDALVSVRALTAQPVRLELRCYLAPVGTTEPWEDATAVGSYVEPVDVSPGEPEVAGCRFASLPEEGDWQLSAFLRRAGSGGGLEDALYSKKTVVVGPGQVADAAEPVEEEPGAAPEARSDDDEPDPASARSGGDEDGDE